MTVWRVNCRVIFSLLLGHRNLRKSFNVISCYILVWSVFFSPLRLLFQVFVITPITILASTSSFTTISETRLESMLSLRGIRLILSYFVVLIFPVVLSGYIYPYILEHLVVSRLKRIALENKNLLFLTKKFALKKKRVNLFKSTKQKNNWNSFKKVQLFISNSIFTSITT